MFSHNKIVACLVKTIKQKHNAKKKLYDEGNCSTDGDVGCQ